MAETKTTTTAKRVGASAFENAVVRVAVSPDAPAGEVHLQVIQNLHLYQLAFWAESYAEADAQLRRLYGIGIPHPLCCEESKKNNLTVLRVQPFKCLLLSSQPVENLPALAAAAGNVLDVSHGWTHCSVVGTAAATLLNRHLAVDLRERQFAIGQVAGTVFHHTGITLWRPELSGQGNAQPRYDLLLPRGFARSLLELLTQN